MTDDQKKLETYLQELEKSLQGLPVVEKSDILLELNTHITESLEKSGKSLEEILRRLGPPQEVAKEYIAEHQSENSFQQPTPSIQPTSTTSSKKGASTYIVVGILFLLIGGSFFYAWKTLSSAKQKIVASGFKENLSVKINEKNGTVEVGNFLKIDEEKGTVNIGELVNVDEKSGQVKILGGLIDVNEKDGTVKIGNVAIENTASQETIQGNGVLKSEARFLEPFHKISMSSGPINLKYTNDDTSKVILKADENLHDIIQTQVTGNTLFIRTKRGTNFKTDHNITLEISQKNLESLKVHASGNAFLKNLKSEALKIEVFGSGNVEANGSIDVLNVKTFGSGNLDLKKLETKIAKLKIMGSANMEVAVSENLTAKTFGSGNVIYSGNPKTIQKKSFGSGKIIKAD